jgi:hypothetical protein
MEIAPLRNVPIDPDLPEFPTPSAGDAVLADQVVAHATEAPGHHAPLRSHCQNCGAELHGAYCHQCGQHDFDFHRSFGHVFLETLENFFHFDEKFFHTIITLLFKPGQLSADFNAGKRVSQMPPFRLYLFVSVLFFFIAFLGGDHAREDPVILDQETGATKDNVARREIAKAATTAREQLDLALAAARTPEDQKTIREIRDLAAKLAATPHGSTTTAPAVSSNPVSGPDAAATTAESVISEAAALPAAASPSEVEGEKTPLPQPGERKHGKPNIRIAKGTNAELGRYLTERGEYAYDHRYELQQAVIHAVPKLLLFCLPIFALFTRVLFRRAGSVYLQHLIIALHFHTFVYLWWLVASGWVSLVDLGSPGLAGLLHFGAWMWLLMYPVVMLHRLFAQSWRRAIFKTMLLGTLHAMTLASGFVLLALCMFLML